MTHTQTVFQFCRFVPGSRVPEEFLGRHRGRRITPIAVKVLGQVLGPHGPSCNSLVLYRVFVFCLRAEHVMYSYVLSFRPEAEIYVELGCMRVVLHLQVTQRCWTSSRIDENQQRSCRIFGRIRGLWRWVRLSPTGSIPVSLGCYKHYNEK